METNTLLETTLALLRERGKYREVAAATGLGYEWIAKLAQNRISDPGVNKIETLHRFLTEDAASHCGGDTHDGRAESVR